MPELRWILLAAGVLLVAGLWWWETRRADRDEAPPSDDEAGDAPATGADGRERTEPQVPAGQDDADDGLPPIRATRRDRATAGRNPPIVDIPADADPELASTTRRPLAPRVSYRDMQDRLDDIPEDLKNLPRDEAGEADQRLPWVRTQPMDRDEVMGKKGGPDAPKTIAPENGATTGQGDEPPASSRQRIVALRLIAPAGRWPGRRVVDALEAEGLVYGKYSIYHREREDGKSIFYVASMVEPGSFDLSRIDTLDFPGVSIFAVLPGVVDAPSTFDMMLATARRLSERLKGPLQDEQGSTLTAQRILNLREELVHLEHVTQRVRKR